MKTGGPQFDTHIHSCVRCGKDAIGKSKYCIECKTDVRYEQLRKYQTSKKSTSKPAQKTYNKLK